MRFLDSQAEFLKSDLKRFNFLSGSVRSGKTFVANAKIIMEVATLERGSRGIICGNTFDTVERNVLMPIYDIIGSNLDWSRSRRSGTIFGREFAIRGANSVKSEYGIRGAEFSWAYCDEVTTFPENFFAMLMTRLSKPKAWMIATCNPDDPSHYIKQKYIDNPEIDSRNLTFLLTDNEFLPEDYKENVVKEFQGVFYQRFILGRWVRAEGSIYQIYSEHKDCFKLVPKTYATINIGIDYGAGSSMTAMICTGVYQNFGGVDALADSCFEGIKDPETLYQRIELFYLSCREKFGKIDSIFCDYGALGQVLTAGLRMYFARKGYPVAIKDCLKGRINDRIQLTLKLMGTNRFQIGDCKELDSAFDRAVWEDGKLERKDDSTTKIDPLDAFEYSFYSFEKYL